MPHPDTLPPRNRYIAFQAEYRFHKRTPQKPYREAVELLRQIAEAWSSEGQHTYAGYLLRSAANFAWGDGDLLLECERRAIYELHTAVDLANSGTLERVAALRLLTMATGANYVDRDPSDVRASLESLYEECGQQLVSLGSQATQQGHTEGFLVRGFELETNFDGTWRAVFPGAEVDDGSIRLGDGWLSMSVSSAFTMFRKAGDYQGAQSAAEMCPKAFTSYGLCGWRKAIAGLLNEGDAAELFGEAAAIFARDVHDEKVFRETGHWSSINVDLWASYFAARAAMAQIVREPERATDLVRMAGAALEGTEFGWGHPQARCLRILVAAVIEILDGDPVVGVANAREALLREGGLSGLDDDDRLALQFFDDEIEAFTLLQSDPPKTSRQLYDALDTLGRISLIGSNVATAVEPTMNEAAGRQLLGPVRTWIHLTLQSITDERVLQGVLLRLMQARLPLYAQVRQGAIEWGKDIVALVETEGRVKLEMFQVKVGNITMAKWRDVMYQLEQMFLVELDGIQLPVAPSSREGILIFNGHLNQHAEPIAAGWMKQQKDQLDRSFRLMHLDCIVNWIVKDRLISDFRRALKEYDVVVVN